MAGTIQCKMFLSVFQQTMISAAARELEPVSLDYPSSGLQSRTPGTERFFKGILSVVHDVKCPRKPDESFCPS